ncbi:MAG: redoxin domain-containing protein [Calditrichaeota bacterium]|nr:redoxin domain-containing protein [Calditrichota bacterium]
MPNETIELSASFTPESETKVEAEMTIISNDPDQGNFGVSMYDDYPGFGLGAMAPDFTLNDVNGKSYTLTNLKGKLVVLTTFKFGPFPRNVIIDKNLFSLQELFKNENRTKHETSVSATIFMFLFLTHQQNRS